MKLIAHFEDVFWENEPVDHLRFTSRVFLKNELGQYAFLHILGEDFLGERNHLETCGGGVEEDESFLDAAIREVKEELGVKAKNYKVIGSIIDRLNPIHRMTCSVFFSADLDEVYEDTNRTEDEKILIDSVLWLYPDEVIRRLSQANSYVDAYVHRRDLRAFIYLLENS